MLYQSWNTDYTGFMRHLASVWFNTSFQHEFMAMTRNVDEIKILPYAGNSQYLQNFKY